MTKKYILKKIHSFLLIVAVLLVGVSSSSPALAVNDAGQWWYSTYKVNEAQSAGWTGKGVKIAVIGQQINPDYPGFSSAHLTVDPNPICQGATVINRDPGKASSHDTGVTDLLIGNGQGAAGIQGIAPDADVTFIGYGLTNNNCTHPDDLKRPTITSFGLALERAIAANVQIVSTSTGVEPAGDDDGAVLAKAIAKGIVIVSATPNDVTQVKNGEAPNSLRGIISVSAVDANFGLQRDSKTGAPVIVPNVSVAAAGVNVPFISPDSWSALKTSTGSSVSAPLVAGMLALTAQKYPHATGNQLIQSLIHNTGAEDHDLYYNPNDGFGYGLASLGHLLRIDPSQYPDQNPLLNKDPGLNGASYLPTDDQIATAKSAVANAASAKGSGSSNPFGGLMAGILIGGAIVLLLIVAAAIVIVVVVIRRKKNAQRTDIV